MKFRIENYLIIFLIILLIISFAFLKFLKTDAGKCVGDPLGYTLQSLEKATDSEVSCSCSAGKKVIYFNSAGTSEITISDKDYGNWSNIKFE